ncbi:MAG: hypothetical protein OEZ41_07970, partial [Nitrospirota bacterium]|nr:hypothetical protein [Nitrospirota bacterium]
RLSLSDSLLEANQHLYAYPRSDEAQWGALYYAVLKGRVACQSIANWKIILGLAQKIEIFYAVVCT